MGHYLDERGNICYKRDTQDGHGGHAREHHEEMRAIAQEEIKKAIPQIQEDAYNHAINNLLEALRADVNTVVDIQLSTGEHIFHDARTKQIIMRNIYDEIMKHLQTKYSI